MRNQYRLPLRRHVHRLLHNETLHDNAVAVFCLGLQLLDLLVHFRTISYGFCKHVPERFGNNVGDKLYELSGARPTNNNFQPAV